MDLILAKVKSDRLKKFYLALYLPSLSLQEMWQSLEEYSSGTFEAYKKGYSRLLSCCGRVTTGKACDVIMKFTLHVRTEAKKLLAVKTRGQRALITNVELVQKILGCLSPEFRSSVQLRLSLKKPVAVAPAATTNNAAPPLAPLVDNIDYDPYEWEEVLNEVERLTRESQAQSGLGEATGFSDPSYKSTGTGRPLTFIKKEDRDALISGDTPPSRIVLRHGRHQKV
ncbi:hypothetical protein BKA70DRAFT_1237227 [Coprinopsis sp. MPI-PUGE-AT-0042]|nr:hypothetical protein BKA70DRAFT_1237227 [Coprinopsis sp. MPI-PUGE-AT-0042]